MAIYIYIYVLQFLKLTLKYLFHSQIKAHEKLTI